VLPKVRLKICHLWFKKPANAGFLFY